MFGYLRGNVVGRYGFLNGYAGYNLFRNLVSVNFCMNGFSGSCRNDCLCGGQLNALCNLVRKLVRVDFRLSNLFRQLNTLSNFFCKCVQIDFAVRRRNCGSGYTLSNLFGKKVIVDFRAYLNGFKRFSYGDTSGNLIGEKFVIYFSLLNYRLNCFAVRNDLGSGDTLCNLVRKQFVVNFSGGFCFRNRFFFLFGLSRFEFFKLFGKLFDFFRKVQKDAFVLCGKEFQVAF